MRKMKRYLGIILALVMVLSMSVPVMATSGNENYIITIKDQFDGHVYEAYQIFSGQYDPTTGILSSIKWGSGFNKNKAGEFLNALQNNSDFGDGNANVFSVVTATDTDKIAQDIAAVMQKWTNDNAYAQAFAKVLHTRTETIKNDGTYQYEYTYLTDDYVESQEKGTENTGGISYHIYEITIPIQDDGYYLIKDEDNSLDNKHDYYTRLLLQVVGDSNITPKGGVPSVDKMVHTALEGVYTEATDIAATDRVYFRLEGTLPSNLSEYEKYEYEFVDTLSDGLVIDSSINNDGIADAYILHVGDTRTQLNFVDNAENAITEYHLIKNTDVIFETDGKKISIKFNDLRGSIPSLLASDKLVIKYAVKLNDNAIIGKGSTTGSYGNKNTVYVQFSNNPQGSGLGKTAENDAEVYNYELDINKVDETGTKKLTGAEFLLYQRVSIATGQANGTQAEQYEYHYAKVSKIGDVYKIVDWVKVSEPIIEEARELDGYVIGSDNYAIGANNTELKDTKGQRILLDNLTVVSDGTNPIRIRGLDATVYWLHELNAPLSYNELDSDVQVAITPTYDSNGELTSLLSSGTTTGVTNLEDGTVTITIQNTKGSTLPSTGGIGTTIFYVVGGLFVLTAVVVLVTKRRMDK